MINDQVYTRFTNVTEDANKKKLGHTIHWQKEQGKKTYNGLQNTTRKTKD